MDYKANSFTVLFIIEVQVTGHYQFMFSANITPCILSKINITSIWEIMKIFGLLLPKLKKVVHIEQSNTLPREAMTILAPNVLFFL